MSEKKITDLADLIPDKRNARKHNPRNVGMITEAIQDVGVSRSGVIDEDGNILAGNGTFEALSEAGIRKVKVVEADGQEWVVVRRKGLSAEQKTKLALYDNRTAELADWDADNMAEILGDYPGIFEKMFSDDELDGILDMGGDPGELEGEDDASEPPKDARTNLGDIYTLGTHRLMCGDSTKKEQVDQLMGGQKADMVFTDPPYGIDYSGIKDKSKIKNDKMSDPDFISFLKSSLMGCEVMYVCCSWQKAHLFKEAMTGIAREPKSMIVWDKVNPAQHLDKYFKQHELIYYYGDFGGSKTLRGDVWQLKRQRNTVHPTMKPIELIEMAMLDQPGRSNVYDGFGGSGSTMIACQKLERKCFMMELDPAYCDVIVGRFHGLFPDKPLFLNDEEISWSELSHAE